MGRFEHLELGDWLPQQPEAAPESGVIDQNYYVAKADAAFADENFERALAFYSRALQYDVNLEEAWVGQLRCLIEMQELQEAIIWSNRALERFPNGAQVLAARAAAESRLGRTAPAIGYSDSAMAAKGCAAYCWISRGEVLIGVNPDNARACFAKAIELAASDWAVRSWIAKAYIVRGRYHQALEHLRVAVRLDPERFPCWYWIGKCCEALGEMEEARRAYGRALAAEPRLSIARDALHRLENSGLFSKLGSGIKRLFKRRK
ncbi:MAG: tetratricopeptide repeat protein [Armatimonadetes bacterium]|nr:tetratricopeptide repeat protein [Armatimonadota bacterium]